jgi:hypothetical protein
MIDNDEYRRFLRWRGVKEPCPKCSGRGCYAYSNGATWRGGMGTTSPEWDVCDVCWGTGDEHRHGVDLRKQREQFNATVALEAGKHLSLGVGGIGETRPAIEAIADELDRLARGRKDRPRHFYSLVGYLAHKVRDMAKVPT